MVWLRAFASQASSLRTDFTYGYKGGCPVRSKNVLVGWYEPSRLQFPSSVFEQKLKKTKPLQATVLYFSMNCVFDTFFSKESRVSLRLWMRLWCDSPGIVIKLRVLKFRQVNFSSLLDVMNISPKKKNLFFIPFCWRLGTHFWSFLHRLF